MPSNPLEKREETRPRVTYSVEYAINGKWVVIAHAPLNTNLASAHRTEKLALAKLKMIQRVPR